MQSSSVCWEISEDKWAGGSHLWELLWAWVWMCAPHEYTTASTGELGACSLQPCIVFRTAWSWLKCVLWTWWCTGFSCTGCRAQGMQGGQKDVKLVWVLLGGQVQLLCAFLWVGTEMLLSLYALTGKAVVWKVSFWWLSDERFPHCVKNNDFRNLFQVSVIVTGKWEDVWCLPGRTGLCPTSTSSVMWQSQCQK